MPKSQRRAVQLFYRSQNNLCFCCLLAMFLICLYVSAYIARVRVSVCECGRMAQAIVFVMMKCS
jgi:hypothetical protein